MSTDTSVSKMKQHIICDGDTFLSAFWLQYLYRLSNIFLNKFFCLFSLFLRYTAMLAVIWIRTAGWERSERQTRKKTDLCMLISDVQLKYSDKIRETLKQKRLKDQQGKSNGKVISRVHKEKWLFDEKASQCRKSRARKRKHWDKKVKWLHQIFERTWGAEAQVQVSTVKARRDFNKVGRGDRAEGGAKLAQMSFGRV